MSRPRTPATDNAERPPNEWWKRTLETLEAELPAAISASCAKETSRAGGKCISSAIGRLAQSGAGFRITGNRGVPFGIDIWNMRWPEDDNNPLRVTVDHDEDDGLAWTPGYCSTSRDAPAPPKLDADDENAIRSDHLRGLQLGHRDHSRVVRVENHLNAL